jgi:hypothetical protein
VRRIDLGDDERQHRLGIDDRCGDDDDCWCRCRTD